MSIKTHRFLVGANDEGRRADRILRILLPDLPLSILYKLLRNGDIRLDGKKIAPDSRVAAGQELLVSLAERFEAPRPGVGPTDGKDALAFSAMLLFKNDDLAIVNKPLGMLTHGSGGLDELAVACLSGDIASLAFTPAPLHRLDRNTSGALAISASIRGAHAFAKAMAAGSIRKRYLALVEGCLDTERRWEDRLARDSEAKKSAVTDSQDGDFAACVVTPVLPGRHFSLVAVFLETGRTHQIRVQCASHGFPLRGDQKYGGSRSEGGYVLHAASLFFPANMEVPAPARVDAPLPPTSSRAIAAEFGERRLEKALELLD